LVVDTIAIDQVNALQADFDTLFHRNEVVCVRACVRLQDVPPELRHMKTRVNDDLPVACRFADTHITDDVTASRDWLLPSGAKSEQTLAPCNHHR